MSLRMNLPIKLPLLAIALLWPAAQTVAEQPGSGATLQDGGIVFHRSQTRQSAAIVAATGSEYTHIAPSDIAASPLLEVVQPAVNKEPPALLRGVRMKWRMRKPIPSHAFTNSFAPRQECRCSGTLPHTR